MIFDGDIIVLEGLVKRLAPKWEAKGADPADVAADIGGIWHSPLVRPVLDEIRSAPENAACCDCKLTCGAHKPELSAALAYAMVHFDIATFRKCATRQKLRAGFSDADAPWQLKSRHRKALPEQCRDAWDLCAELGLSFGFCEREGRLWFFWRKGTGRFLRGFAARVGQKGGKLQVTRARPEHLLALKRPGEVRVVVIHELPWSAVWRELELYAAEKVSE